MNELVTRRLLLSRGSQFVLHYLQKILETGHSAGRRRNLCGGRSCRRRRERSSTGSLGNWSSSEQLWCDHCKAKRLGVTLQQSAAWGATRLLRCEISLLGFAWIAWLGAMPGREMLSVSGKALRECLHIPESVSAHGMYSTSRENAMTISPHRSTSNVQKLTSKARPSFYHSLKWRPMLRSGHQAKH